MKNSKKSLTELSLAASVEIVSNTSEVVGGAESTIMERARKEALYKTVDKSLLTDEASIKKAE